MRKLYVKLAAVNIRNNRQLYLPYLLAGVFSAAMFYLVMSIQDNPGLEQMRGGRLCGGNAAARSDSLSDCSRRFSCFIPTASS